ncbi:Enoyl-CoA hydratase [Collimonas sp. OK607]|uniref:enoyl-CoA hydratase/isomerase family protein n=1 Tax=Collimonas sp. OK607 TaxID=1798194 RepID=UPI0008F2443A|nr:enoyl-CoA hydratase-related protein [Collimonas sp. OK607]SFB35604.1 Enoyl-CoA hydratase [Collimonas sp. OK607]
MNEPKSPLQYFNDGAIARIVFNRPEALNAIDTTMASAFHDACLCISADPMIRVVVLSGAGRAFMAGGDIAQFRDDPQSIPTTLIDPMHEGLMVLTSLKVPVVASLQGAVAGAGLSIALACDLAIAAEGTKFNFAYSNLATSCDLGASWSLPRLVGLRRALEIALLPEAINTVSALQIGLINQIVPADNLVDATDALAQRLASGPTVAYGMLKRLMRESLGNSLGTQLNAERASFSACATTSDFKEAVVAFLEKRPPTFKGR